MPRYCVKDGCKTYANFNVEGETNPMYCKSHKLVGMVNVRGKRCIDCKKTSTF